MNQEHWHEDFELENRRFSQGWNQDTATKETLATERVPVAQPEGTATAESTDSVLVVRLANYNLRVARSNLLYRITNPRPAPCQQYEQLEAEEDIAKWERIVERLKHVR
jgi:hypothetical protein